MIHKTYVEKSRRSGWMLEIAFTMDVGGSGRVAAFASQYILIIMPPKHQAVLDKALRVPGQVSPQCLWER